MRAKTPLMDTRQRDMQRAGRNNDRGRFGVIYLKVNNPLMDNRQMDVQRAGRNSEI